MRRGTIESAEPGSKPDLLARLLAHPLTYVVIGVGVLVLDLLSGTFLRFPILFVVPVGLCAWFCTTRWAYGLAVLLPFGRFLIIELEEVAYPLLHSSANAVTRIVVLTLLVHFISRTARQSRALQQRVSDLVRICAWSRTVEYEGEWLSFEEYLKRRFDIDTSHGISPAEAQKILQSEREKGPNP